MNELEFLSLQIGGQKVSEMSSLSFLQWVGEKINGIRAFSADAVELTSLIQYPPMSRNMTKEKKIEILRKLERLKIQIP